MRFRRKKRHLRFSKIIFLLSPLLIILSAVLLFRFNIFAVNNIEVQSESTPCTDNNQINDIVKLKGQNFFLINSSKIENSLKKKFLCIKSVAISKYFPGKVNLHIFGRQPVAALVVLKDKPASPSSLLGSIATPSGSQVEDVYVADDENVIFSKEAGQLNIPKIYVFDLKVSLGQKLEDSLTNCLKILSQLKTLKVEVDKSWISDNFLVVDLNQPGPKIIFRVDEKIDIQLASLQLILSEAKIDANKLEFIDLRYDKPIVRFAPKNSIER